MPTTTSPEELKEVGLQQFQQGHYAQAVDTFTTAVSAYHDIGDENGRAEMLNNIGVTQRTRKKNKEAVAAFNEAMTIFQEQGDLHKLAQSQANLADFYQFTKQQNEAARYYSEAAATFAQLGDRQKQSQVLRAYSLMRMRQGQWLDALLRMEESLSVRPRLGPFRWLFRAVLRFALGLMGAR